MKYHCLRFIVRKRQTTSAFFSSSCSILFNEHKDSNLYNSQSRIGSNSHIKCSSLMCVKNRLSKHSFEEEKKYKNSDKMERNELIWSLMAIKKGQENIDIVSMTSSKKYFKGFHFSSFGAMKISNFIEENSMSRKMTKD